MNDEMRTKLKKLRDRIAGHDPQPVPAMLLAELIDHMLAAATPAEQKKAPEPTGAPHAQSPAGTPVVFGPATGMESGNEKR
jgi:hypothetical protein